MPSRMASSKTANAAYIKKALAKFLAIFKPKCPRLLFQDWFLSSVDSPSRLCHLCPKVPGGKKCPNDPPPTLFSRFYPNKLFSLSKNEVGAGWPLTVPGQLQDELGRGPADYRQR